jgi:glycosyltransferase involved in cell wall biosynthesis
LNILQLCIRIPFIPNDGATIAMNNAAKSLMACGASLKSLAFNTNKNFIPLENIPPEIRMLTRIEAVPLNLSVRPLQAFLNLFSKESLHVIRFRSAAFEQLLIKTLSEKNYDAVWFEGLYMSPYLETVRKYSDAKAIMRSHNVEFVIWERLAKACSQPVKKWYLGLLAARLKNYELQMLNRFDALLPITPVDADHYRQLGCTVPMLTFPIGVDTGDYAVSVPGSDKSFSVFHLGSMDWMPNLEAVDWFLNKVFPLLVKKDPEINIVLAGKNMPERIFRLADKNLKVYGKIDDPKTFMADKHVMIVPLLSGGGMRVKIIEGMAAGKAIVSTSVGAEGINYTNGLNIMIADKAEDFCNAILQLKRDSALRESVSFKARKLIEEEYDNDVLGKRVMKFLESL